MILGNNLIRTCRPLTNGKKYSTAVPKQTLVARYTKNGPPQDVLKLQTEDLPAHSKTGVTVKFLYSPINPADLNMI